MNSVIELLKNHRSIRKFTEQKIDDELLTHLIQAGQAAATSSFLQGATIIRVTKPEIREAFVRLSGNQTYIQSAPEFLVFCADLKRSSACCEMHDKAANNGFTEQFIIATVDAALMAQNVVTAAESANLGICYIGGIRNNPVKVTELLKLPKEVFPVFGLCLGYPDQDPEVKPRLPVSVVMKTDTYNDTNDQHDITAYDEHVQEYYRTRTGGKKSMGWSEQMASLLSKESRPHMRAYLENQNFMKK